MIRSFKAQPSDSFRILPQLRQMDRDEIFAMYGTPVAILLPAAVRDAEWAEFAVYDGEPLALYGVSKVSTDVGSPWLVMTDAFEHYRRAIGRRSRLVFEKMKRNNRILFNYVHARNDVAIEWLDWLGFEIKEKKLMGWAGEPFHPFEWRAD